MLVRSLARSLALVFGLALVAPACAGSDPDASSEDVKATGVSFTVIDAQRPNAKAGVTVIKSAAAFADFFGTEPPSSVDFKKQWVVHYSAGMKKTGGYHTEITKIEKTGPSGKRTLLVHTRDVSPADDCIVTQATTNPQVAVAINKQPDVKSSKADPEAVVQSCKPEPLGAPELNACVRAARECTFAKLEASLDADGARALFDGCMSEVVLDDPDFEGVSCAEACTGDGAKLCDAIVALVPYYAAKPAACVETLGGCVDGCYVEGDNWNDGIAPDEMEQTSEWTCLVHGGISDCDEFSRAHATCGGTIKPGTNDECLKLCAATAGAWTDDQASLDEYCAGQCGSP